MERSSTYEPLFSRLFGERQQAREMREVRELYDWVKAHHDADHTTRETFGDVINHGFFEPYPREIASHFDRCARKLLDQESVPFDMPEPEFHRMDLREFMEYRTLLGRKQHFYANKDEMQDVLYQHLGGALETVLRDVPEIDDPSPFTIPLIYALERPRYHVEVVAHIIAKAYGHGFFQEATPQLYRNMCRASGRDPDDQDSKKQIISPSDSTLPLDEFAETYLGGTPLYELFMAPVPLRLTHQDRFNHWHVLAGSGQGKTVLIENMIRYDILSDDPPGVVLIDPHSDLVRKLTRSDLGIRDRLILIDPRDTKYPVPLNPFAINRERFQSYDEVTREQVTAGVIQTMGYLFTGITNLPLTGKQDVFFKYVTRLLLTMSEVRSENATILDMLQVVKNPRAYQDVIDELPDIQREFFEEDFKTKTFDGTKEQVRYRLQAIIENPTLARLFTSKETIDLFSELNRPEGSVILVDTAKDFLKEGSAAFGKLMISLILQAVLERAAIAEHERKSTFLFVDEAGSFFSTNIDDLLTEARKYKCGLVLAHQYLDQASSSLRSSLAANTGIKFAGGLSAQDAATMARDMRTTADMILDQPKLHFAAHIRGVTPTAVSIPIRPVYKPRLLSDDAYENQLFVNRLQFSTKSDFTEEEVERILRESREAAHNGEELSEEFYVLLKADLSGKARIHKSEPKPAQAGPLDLERILQQAKAAAEAGHPMTEEFYQALKAAADTQSQPSAEPESVWPPSQDKDDDYVSDRGSRGRGTFWDKKDKKPPPAEPDEGTFYEEE